MYRDVSDMATVQGEEQKLCIPAGGLLAAEGGADRRELNGVHRREDAGGHSKAEVSDHNERREIEIQRTGLPIG